MEQGGLMVPTAPQQKELTPTAGPAMLQEKQVSVQSTSVAATGPTSSIKTEYYSEVETVANKAFVGGKMTILGYKTVSRQLGPYQSVQVDTAKTSVQTPDFRRLVRTGAILPVNPFSNFRKVRKFNYRVEDYVSTWNGQLDVERHGAGYYRNDFIPNATGLFTQPSSSQLSSLDREARLKIRLALKNQKVNIAQILAERDKTASTIAKIVKTIAEVIMKARKGDLVGAAGALGQHIGYRKRRRAERGNPTEALANAWLELQYAIKPLLMDVNGLVEELANHQYPKATGTAVATAILNVDHKIVNGRSTTTEQGSVKIRYTCYFQINYPEMPNITRLGLTNPAQLAWELIPFSFVLDWLISIGGWLSSLDATVGLSFSDGSKSVKRDLTQVCTHVEKSSTTAWDGYGTVSTVRTITSTSSFSEESLVRTKLSSFPDVAFPPFKNPASLIHLASALALLRKAI